MKNNFITRHKSNQIASCLRLQDKNGKSYRYNRKQRRAGKIKVSDRCYYEI